MVLCKCVGACLAEGWVGTAPAYIGFVLGQRHLIRDVVRVVIGVLTQSIELFASQAQDLFAHTTHWGLSPSRGRTLRLLLLLCLLCKLLTNIRQWCNMHVVLLFSRAHFDSPIRPEGNYICICVRIYNLLLIYKTGDICSHLWCLHGSLLCLLNGWMFPTGFIITRISWLLTWDSLEEPTWIPTRVVQGGGACSC